MGIETLDASAIPLLNTVILFMSGISVTASQHYIVAKNRKCYIVFSINCNIRFNILIFSNFMNIKILYLLYLIVFGASFFLLTGFHGFPCINRSIIFNSIINKINSISLF